MPRATASQTDTIRYELKSLPASENEEAGFVELRKLSYGQILERRDMAGKMVVNMPSTGRRDEDMKAAVDLAQQTATAYEFKHCIVSHNLEDDNGNLLNFGDSRTIAMLDPSVGQEIAQLIDDLNDFEADLSGKA